MSTAVLVEPVVQELQEFQVVPVHEEAPILSRPQAKTESHPLLLVFIACVVALHIAGAAIGSVAAWVYFLRHSGAFTP
jgi:hypothetical protein